jgi:hypothetical protein
MTFSHITRCAVGDRGHGRDVLLQRSVGVLLTVDQGLRECATHRVAPELSDPVGPVEVGEHEDVEQLGARSRPKGHRDLPEVGAPARRVSLPEATVEPSPGFRRACPYAFANTGAT